MKKTHTQLALEDVATMKREIGEARKCDMMADAVARSVAMSLLTGNGADNALSILLLGVVADYIETALPESERTEKCRSFLKATEHKERLAIELQEAEPARTSPANTNAN